MTTFRNVRQNDKSLRVACLERLSSPNLVVLLHGLGCAKECFDGAFKSAHLQDYSLCAIDWIGHGESDKPTAFSYSLEDQADIALRIIRQIPYTQVSIVGHSMGGGVGLLMAKKLRNLRGFISVEGLLGGGAYSKRIANFTQQEFIDTQHELFLDELQNADSPAFKQWSVWYEKASPLALYKSAQSMVSWAEGGKLFDLLNDLPHKAYFYGDNDNIQELLPHFTSVETRHIPGGHFLMQDNPAELYGAVARRLAQAVLPQSV